jgi:hypothetical protein
MFSLLMIRPRQLLTAALLVACSPTVWAVDWSYAGSYADLDDKEYMSFINSSSVRLHGNSAVDVLVRSVWAKNLYAYWKKHGNDKDILDAGLERVMSGDTLEYYSLASVSKILKPSEIEQKQIVAMGHEFIVNAGRVSSRVDILCRINCKQHRFANLSAMVYSPTGKVLKTIKPHTLEYYKIESGTEQDYLSQLTCKHIL